jgi:hypothetical protein
VGLRPASLRFAGKPVAQNEIAPTALDAEGRLSFQRTATPKRHGLAPVVSDIRLSEAAFELFWIETLGRVLIRPSKSSPPAGKWVFSTGTTPECQAKKTLKNQAGMRVARIRMA